MKKIISFLTTISLVLTCIVVPVKGNENNPTLKSINSNDFKNEVNAGEEFSFTYELNDSKLNANFTFVYQIDDNEIQRIYAYKIEENIFSLKIDEVLKYKGQKYKFLYLQVGISGNDSYTQEYYSYMNRDEIKQFDEYFSSDATLFQDLKYDYSFKLLDSDIDNVAPTMSNFEFIQTGRKYKIEFDCIEEQSGVESVFLNYSGFFLHFSNFETNNGHYISNIGEFDQYQSNKYGTYTLNDIQIRDKAGNESYFTEFDGVFIVRPEDNPLEKLNKDNTLIYTKYYDNKIHLRQDGIGETIFTLAYINENEHIKRIYNNCENDFDTNKIDLSQSKSYEVNFTLEINPGKFTYFTKILDVVIEKEILGKIIKFDQPREIIRKIEGDLNYYSDLEHSIIVQLNSGEIIEELVKVVDGGGGPGFDKDGIPIIVEGGFYAYNPKYRLEGSDNGHINLEKSTYTLNKNGDLLDRFGNVYLTYDERPYVDYISKDGIVKVTTKLKSVPSYTEVLVAENNTLDSLFDGKNYVAYDVNLQGQYRKVNLIENVNVAIALPDSLKGKDIELYELNEGNRTKIADFSLTNDNVSFTTDHISTYVIVEKEVEAISITLNQTELNLVVNESENLVATVNPSNATDKTLRWKTNNSNVAVVNESGKVTAIGEGTATITVITSNGLTATCKVTVGPNTIEVTSVTLNKAELDLVVNESENLVATVNPSNATDKTLRWKTNNSNVAVIDQNGKVTAIGEGTATITVTTSNGLTATCKVTVRPNTIEVTSVTLNKTELDLVANESETLIAKVNPSNATDKTLRWETNNSNVAVVDQNGKVTAIDEGTAIITVTTSNGHYATCNVHVSNPVVKEGWIFEFENWYYYKNGVKQTGWLNQSGVWYYLANSGEMLTGWQKVNGYWYYFNDSGVMQTGWLNLSGTWYLLSNSGYMLTDWQKINGYWYYFNDSGVMQTGWLNLSGTWYLLADSGYMLTGWQQVNGSWYYLNGSGAMQTNWQKVNGYWYYFNDSGVMQTGWLNDSGNWYLLADSGYMLTGWQQVNGTWYYLNVSGVWVA